MLKGAITLALPLAAGAAAVCSPRETPSRVAGTFIAQYTEQHPLNVPDAAGHTLLLVRADGRNRSTGPTPYMEGAAGVNLEMADLTQGNGSDHGYLLLSRDADSVMSKWSGKVTTTLSSNQTPSTTFDGTWTAVKSTGRYHGVAGHGTYKGQFTSRTSYAVEWQGELSSGATANPKPRLGDDPRSVF
jgi:hypothetical protein